LIGGMCEDVSECKCLGVRVSRSVSVLECEFEGTRAEGARAEGARAEGVGVCVFV